MRANELLRGDYVMIDFSSGVQPQLAEVINIDYDNETAEILPERQNDIVRIAGADQWRQIQPVQLVCQLLHALGFSEISLERAYGWTSVAWTKVSYSRKYIFNLTYADNSWNLEVCWIENNEPKVEQHGGIQYIHELQHILYNYNF